MSKTVRYESQYINQNGPTVLASFVRDGTCAEVKFQVKEWDDPDQALQELGFAMASFLETIKWVTRTEPQ